MAVTQTQIINSLEKARTMITHGWITGAWAHDHNKKNVDPWDESACEWCTEGAILGATHFESNAEELAKACLTIIQVANPIIAKDPHQMAKVLAKQGGAVSRIDPSSVIPHINDSRLDRKGVIALFTRGIELVKQATWK